MAFEEVGVRAVIKGFRSFLRDLGKMDAKSKGYGRTLGTLGKTALATGAGFVAAQAAMAGVRTIMSKSIGAAVAYEAQMAEIRALTGATEKDTDLLTVAIKDMTRNMPKSPEELGSAAYFILSSGIEDAAEAAGVLEVAARASTIGLGETESVANALTTVLNAYGKSAGEAGAVTDVMIEAVKQGKAEASEFAGVLGRVVPLAAQMGISFEEVAANLATFTRLGVSADEAATGLRQVMASLLKPTEDQEEAMQELGFTAEGLRKQIREEGLLRTLDAMTKATGGNEAAVSRLFPNIRALTSVLGTAGVQMDAYTDILAATENATGNLEEGFAIVADTAKAKMGIAMNEINLLLMELGEEILPALVPAIRAVVFAFKTLDEALVTVKLGIKIWGAALDGLAPKEDLAIQKLQSMAANAEITKATFLELAEGIGLTTMEAKKLAADTSFPTQMEVWRQRAVGFGFAAEEVDRLWEEAGAGFGMTAEGIQTEIDRMIQRGAALADEMAEAASAISSLDDAIDDLRASIAAVSGAQEDNLATISSLTGARTQEQIAIDQEINALKQEQNAALQAEAGQSSLGGAVGSTTDALDKQIGSLQNLAASMVPQALRDEIIALESELTALSLSSAEIEGQIMERERLLAVHAEEVAAVQEVVAALGDELAALERTRDGIVQQIEAEKRLMAERADTLPSTIKVTKLELERARLMEKADGVTDNLTDAEQARLKEIESSIKTERRAIKVRDLEADVTKLQAQESGEHLKALEDERREVEEQIQKTVDLRVERERYIETLRPQALLDEITALGAQKDQLDSQIGATTNLKAQREAYIDTLMPIELEQEIDALERQRTALGNAETGARDVGGAVQSLSGVLGDQITKLGLERDAIDLVTEGWGLQAKAMLDLPTIQDIGAGLQQFKEFLILQLQAQATQLDLTDPADAGKWRTIMEQLDKVLAFKAPQFHSGAFEVPRDMLGQLQAGEMVLPRRTAQVVRDLIRVPAAPVAAAAGAEPRVIERRIEVNVTDGSPAAIANAVKMADIELGLRTATELEGLS